MHRGLRGVSTRDPPGYFGGALGISLAQATLRGAARRGNRGKMGDRVLIAGGAGFIGSHLADELLRQGHPVRALDCLSAQVHGAERRRHYHLADDVELVNEDIRDPEAVRTALRGVDVVFHFAAMVGDVRHWFADASAARRLLDWEPTVSFDRGLAELAAWLEGQVPEDRAALARAELEAGGLTS